LTGHDLALAFGEFYLSLRAGRDRRAGLWLACLLIKPQYLFFLLPLLVWKRRWNVLAGVDLGGLVIVVGSLLVAGPSAVLDYPRAILAEGSDFNGWSTYEFVPNMVNWRALFLRSPNGLDQTANLLLIFGLSLLTVTCAALTWRGRWAPRGTGPRGTAFPAQVLVAVVATLLASYHSHMHGLLFIAMPLGAVLAAPTSGLFKNRSMLVAARYLTAACVLALTLRYTLTGSESAAPAAVALIVALLGMIVLLRSGRRRYQPDPATTLAHERQNTFDTPRTAGSVARPASV